MTTEINDEYLRYWNILDQDESGKPNTGIYKTNTNYENYRKYYIDNKEGYPEYIKNINLDDDIPDISINPIVFIKRILEELFYTISVKPYLKTNQTVKMKNISIVVNRPNHGGLNHFRSVLFGAYITYLFITINPTDFKKYITTNKIELIFLIIASYFKSLLRVDEGSNIVQFFNTDTDNKNFEKIFININKNEELKTYFTNGLMGIHMSGIAASFLFMSICKYLKKKITIINKNLSDVFIEKIGLGLCMYEEDINVLQNASENKKSIFLIYELVVSGHYLDHCRASFSEMLLKPHISNLITTIKIEQNEKDIRYVKIIKYMILLLAFTEWNYDNPDADDDKDLQILIEQNDKYWQDIIKKNITDNSSLEKDQAIKNICKSFNNGRGKNQEFYYSSIDFSRMYSDINTEFNTFINFKKNINEMIQIIEKEETDNSNSTLSRISKPDQTKNTKLTPMPQPIGRINSSGGNYKNNKKNKKNLSKNKIKTKKKHLSKNKIKTKIK